MNKNALIFLFLIIVISLFLGLSNPNFSKSINPSMKEFDADFNLEEFILNNEPTEHDIKEFPITEAFQFTTDIDKVYNRWELIRAKLSKAREAEKENQQLMRTLPRKMKENKNELDSLMAGVLQGNSKTNAMGVFTDLEVMQKTGDKYLRHIKQDLQSLEKEAGIATGNTTAAIRLITTGKR
jgi:hypothetical protein